MVGKLNNMSPKQLLKSFALEGKISEAHGEQIEEMLAEALKERDEQLEELEYNSQAEGCGLEDRGITDRYEAMQYGWEQAIIAVKELLDKKE